MKFSYLFIVIFITGCASLAPVKPTGNLISIKDPKTNALLLEKQARKCWAKKQSLSKDGIRIDARKSFNDSYLISASRYAHDIGTMESHFIVEVLKNKQGGSIVKTREGDYVCSMAGYCVSLDHTSDVKRWLNGDLKCSIMKTPLL